MNIMGWVYSKVAALVGSPGHTALGGSLMIGKYYKLLLYLFGLRLTQREDLKLASVEHQGSGYTCFISVSARDTRSLFCN